MALPPPLFIMQDMGDEGADCGSCLIRHGTGGPPETPLSDSSNHTPSSFMPHASAMETGLATPAEWLGLGTS